MKKMLAIALTMIAISVVHAEQETTNVFCATSDGSHWDWLEVEGMQVRVSGEWERGSKSDGSYFDYFTVLEGSYLLLNQMCRLQFSSEYVAQPADGLIDSWYVFMVNRLDGSRYLANGRHHVTSRDLLPSAFRL